MNTNCILLLLKIRLKITRAFWYYSDELCLLRNISIGFRAGYSVGYSKTLIYSLHFLFRCSIIGSVILLKNPIFHQFTHGNILFLGNLLYIALYKVPLMKQIVNQIKLKVLAVEINAKPTGFKSWKQKKYSISEVKKMVLLFFIVSRYFTHYINK